MSEIDVRPANYFYSLRFELYPTSNVAPTNTSTALSQLNPSKKSKKAVLKGRDRSDSGSTTGFWFPTQNTDIFDFLPGPVNPRGLRSSLCDKPKPTSAVAIHRTNSITHEKSSSPAHVTSRGQTSANLPNTIASIGKRQVAQGDWRFASVRIDSLDMTASTVVSAHTMSNSVAPEKSSGKIGLGSGPRLHETRARIEPLKSGGLRSTEVGWGIVHLYREGEESLSLSQPPSTLQLSSKDEDTTILCIPAVPSYMTPSDFLGWAGEKTVEQVSNVRFVMTGQLNRYLVLMKFRNGDDARKWKRDWDGKVFGGMEPENCHVLFIRSIIFDTPSQASSETTSSFPDTSHDPFIPNLAPTINTDASTALDFRPLPPPTSSLVELPTCPVCLERMDSTTTGLLTILCRHVFHCACLQKWRGSGCPVCRHVQPSSSHNLSRPFGSSEISHDFCATCDTQEDLWICLICGNVGCGRYKGGHAKEHWKDSAHCFALEIETQYVWDYAGDAWVHRLIQTKGDGKLVELPANNSRAGGIGQNPTHADDIDMVPRAKLDGMGMEYTHLLTSQLESQRVYFEEQVKKAVDKAASAAASAEAASATSTETFAEFEKLRGDLDRVTLERNALEKERDRLKTRAEKSAEVARKMTTAFQEEKQVGQGLLARVDHVQNQLVKLAGDVGRLQVENEDLKEQNRDLGFFISSQEKLKQVEGELGEEIKEGTMSLPEKKEPMRFPRGKGKK